MIDIACISSPEFVRHSGTMLRSALSCMEAGSARVHVLHDRHLHESEREKLLSVARAHDASLRFIAIDDRRIQQLPQYYFSRSVWLRILLPELLPGTDRVLYLDSDMVITDDLRILWQTDLGENLLGAVTNLFYPFMPDHPRDRLGIDNPADYFNSGVLLMDLDRMRTENTVDALCRFAGAHPDADYPDQDALNAVCQGRWHSLHPRWNAQTPLFEVRAEQLSIDAELAQEALADPAIVHYIGPFKPWQYLCRHPLQAVWFHHAEHTPWGEPVLEGRNLENRILRRLSVRAIDRVFSTRRRLSRLRSALGRRLRRLTGATR